GPLAQVGLALATAIGAWINFVLVAWFARRAGLFAVDDRLKFSAVRLAAAGAVLAVALWLASAPGMALVGNIPRLRKETAVALLAVIGAAVYGGFVLAFFGRAWLSRKPVVGSQ